MTRNGGYKSDMLLFHMANGNSGRITFKNEKPKYAITDPSGKIAEAKDVKLHLHYNVQPWVGPLTWTQSRDVGGWKKMVGGESEAFTLPALKKKDDTKAAGS